MAEIDKIELDFRLEDMKDWHQTVAPDFRKRMIKNLVDAMSSSVNPFNDEEQYNKALLINAGIIEAEKFYKAESRADYYHLIAKSIYESHQAVEKLENWQSSPELPRQFDTALNLAEDESSEDSD
ncbi:nejire [Carabus blaptoides fortunei]